MPHPARGGAQPAPLTVIAHQHLRHRQADQLGAGHLRPLPRTGTGKAQHRDDPVGQLHIECDQGSVQVGDHNDFPRSDVCEHADLGHSSPATSG